MILSLDHYSLVEELIRSVHHQTDGHYDIERGLYWIKTSYLARANHQLLFGSFDGDELLSICGLRLNFPDPQSACVSNVFYRSKSLKFKKKVEASEEAYRYAFDNGCRRVLTAMKSSKYIGQWNLVTRYSDFLRSLNVTELHVIKANNEATEDWIKSLLGRQIHSVDYSIREASL